MIRLKSLLKEGQLVTLNSLLGVPQKWDVRNSTWLVTSPFEVQVDTGKSEPTNVYYGSARVHASVSMAVQAKRNDVLIQLAGGPFLVSSSRRSAWRIIRLGRASSMGLDGPRTVIPKSSVSYAGSADAVGYDYSEWKSWIKKA